MVQGQTVKQYQDGPRNRAALMKYIRTGHGTELDFGTILGLAMVLSWTDGQYQDWPRYRADCWTILGQATVRKTNVGYKKGSTTCTLNHLEMNDYYNESSCKNKCKFVRELAVKAKIKVEEKNAYVFLCVILK